jgi:20S proteasome alpha/beta subunit
VEIVYQRIRKKKMGDMNFSLTTFNKTGKLMQIEYALYRVQQGKMALGIKGEKQI